MWSIHWKYLSQLAIKYTKKDQDDAVKPLYSGLHAKKKKNLISKYNQMYDDLHMPILTREMLMELHEQFNFTLKLLVT